MGKKTFRFSIYDGEKISFPVEWQDASKKSWRIETKLAD